jgi:hypothetical protein
MITASDAGTEAQKFAESQNRWSSAFSLLWIIYIGRVGCEIAAS